VAMQGDIQNFLLNHIMYVMVIREEFSAYKTALMQICQIKVY